MNHTTNNSGDIDFNLRQETREAGLVYRMYRNQNSIFVEISLPIMTLIMIISEKSSNNNAQPIDNLRSNVDSDTDSWSRNYLIDVLKQYLATYVLEIVNDKGESVTSRKYYDLAFKLITCFSRVMLLMREVRRDYRF